MSRGGRNLLALTIAVVAFAIANTAFGLATYHNSGDIYLDRSRPGFLPEESENQERKDDYTFPESGVITKEKLEEFLKHYRDELQRLEELGEPFASEALSDETLGL